MNRKVDSRRGLAVTELAVCLPVLLVVLLGTMEVCTMIRLRQKLKIAAYEGARVGVLPNAASENVKWQCQLICDDNRIADYSITLDPPDPTTVNSGDWLTVSVAAPFSSNSLAGNWGFQSALLAESVTLQCP